LLFILLFSHGMAMAATYYSSPNGNGSTCSFENPGALDVDLGKLSAGNTLLLRGGSYRQAVIVNKSGSNGKLITIAGYPNEIAIIDGYNTIPSQYEGTFFKVLGNWLTVKDIEFKDSLWMGLVMRGDHNSAINVYAHGNYENGILVTSTGATVGQR
jgi:hypothetical protein